MRKSAFGLALLLALPAFAQAPLQAKVADLLKDADKWDGKEVTVQGAVEDFKQKTSKRGLPYFTFRLVEKNEKINVYSQGTAERELKEKQMVSVTGVYRKSKFVGGVEFKNEVDITGRKDKKFGVKINAVIQ